MTAPPQQSWRVLLRAMGWTLVSAGVLVILYVVYLVWFTNLGTAREQDALRLEWAQTVDSSITADGADFEDVAPHEPIEDADAAAESTTVDIGDAYAAMWFERPGEVAAPVSADPILIVQGVTPRALRKGPGHYPDTPDPGQPGNFSVAGHRTTYGAPFGELQQLQGGDIIHVQDRAGVVHSYTVTSQKIVSPSAVDVVGDRTGGDGTAVLTLTTCHPKFSAAQRLVVFATLDPTAGGSDS